MTGFSLPPIESLDIDDLASLPGQYRYELRGGNLVVMTPSTYWHKFMARRIMIMLYAAGLEVLQDTGVRGDRPRDCRLPGLGVVTNVPPRRKSYSNLPGSSFRLVVEIVSRNSMNGEYDDKMAWYAERGIAEYWVVDETDDGGDDDALVHIYGLKLRYNEPPAYELERALLLSDLEVEYRAVGDAASTSPAE